MPFLFEPFVISVIHGRCLDSKFTAWCSALSLSDRHSKSMSCLHMIVLDPMSSPGSLNRSGKTSCPIILLVIEMDKDVSTNGSSVNDIFLWIISQTGVAIIHCIAWEVSESPSQDETPCLRGGWVDWQLSKLNFPDQNVECRTGHWLLGSSAFIIQSHRHFWKMIAMRPELMMDEIHL